MKSSRRERRELARQQKRASQNEPVQQQTPAVRLLPVSKRTIVTLGVGIACIAGLIFLFRSNYHPKEKANHSTGTPPLNPSREGQVVSLPSSSVRTKPLTLETLLEMSPEQIGTVDIAEMNLLCGEGCPGADHIDVPAALATLDDWSRVVGKVIQKNFHRFADDPSEYKNSQNLYKVVMLVLTLQQDMKVHYDPSMMGKAIFTNDQEAIRRDLADDSYFRNAKSVFLHGIMSADRRGTCSSMPVLYAAVGRRLGFPLKIVTSKGHLFLRWEGNGERFNIEGTGRGVDSHEDEFYMKWPLPITKDEVARGEFLKSLSPTEELAVFLQGRHLCLKENERNAEAMVAIAQANRLNPHHPGEQYGVARMTEIVTAGINPGRPSFRSPQREAEIQATKAYLENEEQQRAQLLQQIEQLQARLGNTPNAPGIPPHPFSPQSPFSSGFSSFPGQQSPSNRPFSPFSHQNHP